MPALAIPVYDLDSSGKDYVFALDEAWLRDALRDTGVRGDGTREGAVEVHAQLNGREVLVHGRAHAWLVAECVRCLQDLPIEVSCQLAALYAPAESGAHAAAGSRADPRVASGSRANLRASSSDEHAAARTPARAAKDEELEVDADGPDREFYSGEQVVIDDLVRDYLLLEVPMQPRCELGWDCPNLDLPAHMRSPSGVQSGPASGPSAGEGAIDPRLMPLQKLARGEPDKE